MIAFLAAIAERSVAAFGLALFCGQFVAHEIGYRLGRLRKRHASAEGESVGVVVGGMLGLLAFVLALTLSFSNTRFSERRADTLSEANAIGTAWLRAKAIGSSRGDEIARLLEDYTRARADFVRIGRDPTGIDALNQRANMLQSTMWGHVSSMIREHPGPVSTSLMAALNDVFDASTAMRFAFEMRLPPQLFWLLIAMSLLCMGAVGYQMGLKEKPVRALVAVLTLMWTIVIVDILDLAAARLGNFRTDTAAYDWTLQGFQGGVSIPPSPEER